MASMGPEDGAERSGVGTRRDMGRSLCDVGGKERERLESNQASEKVDGTKELARRGGSWREHGGQREACNTARDRVHVRDKPINGTLNCLGNPNRVQCNGRAKRLCST